MDKSKLRSEMKNRLLAILKQNGSAKSHKACEYLVSTPEFQRASAVMMFLSLPYEVDTSEAILHAWQLGKTVAVPKVSWQQRHIIPVRIDSLETGFSVEASGLRNPTTHEPVPYEEIDLVVTPGLAFDKKGSRLGRGASFYDRFFLNEQLGAVRCGFCFAEQVVDSVPVTGSDQPVDFLVTDEYVIYFKS